MDATGILLESETFSNEPRNGQPALPNFFRPSTPAEPQQNFRLLFRKRATAYQAGTGSIGECTEIHFRSDCQVGLDVGKKVADFAIKHWLTGK